jgi:hypothetical protein
VIAVLQKLVHFTPRLRAEAERRADLELVQHVRLHRFQATGRFDHLPPAGNDVGLPVVAVDGRPAGGLEHGGAAKMRGMRMREDDAFQIRRLTADRRQRRDNLAAILLRQRVDERQPLPVVHQESPDVAAAFVADAVQSGRDLHGSSPLETR